MYILELKTVQSSAIRVLIEALKEILTDVNIIFDETGIHHANSINNGYRSILRLSTMDNKIYNNFASKKTRFKNFIFRKLFFTNTSKLI